MVAELVCKDKVFLIVVERSVIEFPLGLLKLHLFQGFNNAGWYRERAFLLILQRSEGVGFTFTAKRFELPIQMDRAFV